MQVRKIKEITKDVLADDLKSVNVDEATIEIVLKTKKQNIINALYTREKAHYKATNGRMVNYVALTIDKDLVTSLKADELIELVKQEKYNVSNKEWNDALELAE